MRFRPIWLVFAAVIVIATFFIFKQAPAQFAPPPPFFVCLSHSASSTTYTCNPAPLASFVVIPVSVSWTPDVTNTTTTPTLDLGPGPKPLKDVNGNDVLVGAIVAGPGSVYIVAIEVGGSNIRILSGPVIVPSTRDIQQSKPTICYDANGAHSVDFQCIRTPAGAPLSRGSTVLFSFEGSTNGANATLDVEGTGGAQISFSNGSPIPAGWLAGDGSGTTNYYLLTFDADNDIWIFANQLLGHSGPTCSHWIMGLCDSP